MGIKYQELLDDVKERLDPFTLQKIQKKSLSSVAALDDVMKHSRNDYPNDSCHKLVIIKLCVPGTS